MSVQAVPQLVASQHDRVLLLTITNPSARNALTREIFDSGREIFRKLRYDTTIGAVVLCGEGEHFCGGGNLQRMKAQREKPRHTQAEHVDAAHGWLLAMRECPQPVIAAVEGAAAGGGFALCLACDLVVAAEDAQLMMSYVRIGISPDCGATYWLSRAVPHQLALEMMLDGAPVPVQRLAHAGLINKIVPKGHASTTALDWARKLSNGPFLAQANIKRLTYLAEDSGLIQQLATERDALVDAIYGQENAEGVDAFLARRKADFSKLVRGA